MSPRYRKAIIATLTASGVSPEAAEGQANQILSTLHEGGKTMFSPNISKEKATAVTVAILSASQRSHIHQDTSTKVLVMQGQIIENHRNSLFLIVSLGKTGAENMSGGEPT